MNQKGFTLLELLLSILILTIIFISFMTFFSQSAFFIKKNEEKFSAANTAQMVLNILQEREKEKKDKKEFIIFPENIQKDINNGKTGSITNKTEEFRTILNQDIKS
ncbi:prepilin-type N-terminal cleavage/methylation domain-containing protein, partial [Bacillus sp. JJ1503]